MFAKVAEKSFVASASLSPGCELLLWYRFNITDDFIEQPGKQRLLLRGTYDGEINRYKSTHPRTEKRPQLFNLATDPWEKKNLAADNPKIVKRLAGKIADWYPLKERKALTRWKP